MEKETTYTPPEILDDLDEETIHARMLAVIPRNIDKTEGGFAWDFTRPAAIEKADAMVILNEVVQLFFPEWSSGIYLDKLGANVGVVRKAATAAEANVKIVGVPGTVIPEGFLFSTAATAITENIEYATLEEITLDEEGAGEVAVRCTQTGVIGNVAADSIVVMASPMNGIEELTNEKPAVGGTEIESDDDFRERIMDVERGGSNSFVGCDADYKRWALEVDGVGSVDVIPEWQGVGTGTVKLVIMDSEGNPANQTILSNVYHHIISPNNRDNRLAPIGAILTVITSEQLNISITASVHLEYGYTLEDVQAAYETAILEYFAEAKAENYVRHTRVGSVLSETAGILDYENLLLNGGTANVEIGTDFFPTLQSITLTDADAPVVPDEEPETEPEEPVTPSDPEQPESGTTESGTTEGGTTEGGTTEQGGESDGGE